MFGSVLVAPFRAYIIIIIIIIIIFRWVATVGSTGYGRPLLRKSPAAFFLQSTLRNIYVLLG